MKQNSFVELYKKNDPFALIDVRERKEYVEGHWFGSGTHKNAIWANVSSTIRNGMVNKRISVIVYNEAHLKFVELILSETQTKISNVYCWDYEDDCDHFVLPKKSY